MVGFLVGMESQNKMSKINFKQFLSLIFVVGFFVFLAINFKTPSDIKFIKIAGEKVPVELAITEEAQLQGLSFREDLKLNTGMLFIFQDSTPHYFWMQDMNFPIDIIWISRDREILYIKKDARPEDYPETYGGDKNSKYVLEVSAGFSIEHDLQVGDIVFFLTK